MLFTECPYCRGNLTIPEYQGLRFCTRCGRSLASYSRRSQLKLGLGATVFWVLVSVGFCYTRGGWQNISPTERKELVALPIIFLFGTILSYILDWLLVEVFEFPRKIPVL